MVCKTNKGPQAQSTGPRISSQAQIDKTKDPTHRRQGQEGPQHIACMARVAREGKKRGARVPLRAKEGLKAHPTQRRRSPKLRITRQRRLTRTARRAKT